jgi:hypothetical protein
VCAPRVRADAFTIRLAGPTVVSVTVYVDQGKYPPIADTYFQAVDAMFSSAGISKSYLFPRLPLKASMKYSNVGGEVVVEVYMLDESANLHAQIVDDVQSDDVSGKRSTMQAMGWRWGGVAWSVVAGRGGAWRGEPHARACNRQLRGRSFAMHAKRVPTTPCSQVAKLVSAANLEGSRARIYVGFRSHSFYCLTAGPDAVPSLC